MEHSTDPLPQSASQPQPTPPPPLPVTPPPAQPVKSGGSGWKWLLGCGCLTLLLVPVLFAVLAATMGKSMSTKPFGEKIAIIYVSGAISSQSEAGLFGDSGASSERLVRELRQASKDSSVKAMVIRVNSPGGSAAASQEIYAEMMRIRKTGKPIVVSMGDLAASGGYYIAAAADEIWANNGTLTGSVGVILQSTDMTGLFNKIGIKPEIIKSGKHKDMFSPSRQLTDEERLMAKAMIMDIYNQFVDDVVEGRKHKGMTRDLLLPIADGRVMTGRQAAKVGLVDKVGTLQNAIDSAAQKAGISGEPTIWRVRKSFWESLAEAKFSINPEVKLRIDNGSGADTDLLLGPGGR